MSCPSPHALRGADGVSFANDLEVIGSHATESCVRCRRCGAWFWLSTDTGSKFEYVAAVDLDARLADRAFLQGDVDALARLLVSHRVPHGPIWTTASAMVEIFDALTPGANDFARARALRQQPGGPLWDRAADLYAHRASVPPPARALPFLIDLRLPGLEFDDDHEVGSALVLVPRAQNALLRLEAAGLVSLPLVGAPRCLASRRNAIVFAVNSPSGEAILVLDGAGQATAHPPSRESYAVASLDDDWWQFVPRTGDRERWLELRRPDGTPRVRVRRHFASSEAWMPPARRLGEGWIISNLIDDEGTVQALTLFDADFATAAFSTLIGERAVTPIDAASFWASTNGTIERWVRDGRALERVQTFPCRSSWLVEDVLLIDDAGGQVTALASDGRVLWTWRRSTTGATYGVATTRGVLLYDDVRAHLLDRDGHVVTAFAVEHPDACVGADGTAYLKSTDEFWIARDDAKKVRVPLASELETTCADDALLSLGDGSFVVVTRDGARATFTAEHARFSVFGTLGGPYVVEPGRIRVARFA